MSVINEFYTGDREAIVAALKGEDDQALENPTVVFAKAAWSSHLYDTDLDLLMQAMQDILKGSYKTFQGAWDGRVLDDATNPDHFAAVIKQKVVEMFATCDEEQIRRLAEEWDRRRMLADQRGARAKKSDGWGDRVAQGVAFVVIFLVVAVASVFLRRRRGAAGGGPPNRAHAPADPQQVSKNLRLQLQDLQRVCRVALERGSPLIYYFSL